MAEDAFDAKPDTFRKELDAWRHVALSTDHDRYGTAESAFGTPARSTADASVAPTAVHRNGGQPGGVGSAAARPLRAGAVAVGRGKAGTGFGRRTPPAPCERLDGPDRKDSPFEATVREARVRRAQPEPVAQSASTEWTRDGMPRHPQFPTAGGQGSAGGGRERARG